MTADREALVAEVAGIVAWHQMEVEHRAYPAYACACGQWHGAMDDNGGPNDGQHDTAMGHAAHLADALADLLAAREQQARAEAVANLRVEWTVRHAQGIHPGPFSEKRARQWIADDIRADARRQAHAKGQQRLMRRVVSEWEEVALDEEATA